MTADFILLIFISELKKSLPLKPLGISCTDWGTYSMVLCFWLKMFWATCKEHQAWASPWEQETWMLRAMWGWEGSNSSTVTEPQYQGRDGNGDWGQLNVQWWQGKSMVTRQV